MRRTMSYERGAVVLVRFPFPDLAASKRRPALIISSDRYQAPVMMPSWSRSPAGGWSVLVRTIIP